MSWAEQTRDLRFAIGILRRRPFQVLLQITNRCNMQCSFCDFWPNGVAPREELTVGDFERLAGELSDLGTFVVSIEGGEPLLRPDLVEIVRAFGRRHVPLLYTNGWHLDEPLARRLWDAGLAQVGVSIDYASADRHDARRRLSGACARAWRAVETLRDTAPHRGRQVHVMTVLMRDNAEELDALLQMSAAAGVGHCATLLSTRGFRRAPGAEMPTVAAAHAIARAWTTHPHFRMFGDYMRRIPAFVAGGDMPACHAGEQGFNIDHVGNVAHCIEKIDRPFGNVRQEPLAAIHARIVAAQPARGCQECWTACRGFNQALSDRGAFGTWCDLAGRMRSV